MFNRNGKKIHFALVEPVQYTVVKDGTAFRTTKTSAEWRTEAIRLANALLNVNTYASWTSATPPSGRVFTSFLGNVSLINPLSAETKFVRSVGSLTTEASGAACIIAKAPSHSVIRDYQSTTYKGVICATTCEAVIGAAVSYVMASRIATGVATQARAERLSAALDEVCDAMVVMPFAVTFAAIHDATGMFVGIPNDSYLPIEVRSMSEAKINEILAQIMTAIEACYGDLGPARADVQATFSSSIRGSVSRLINVNQITGRVLTEQEIAQITQSLGSMVAQPAIVMDILGTNMEEIDPIAYVDLIAEVAKRMVDKNPALDLVFSTKDVPRSLAQLMYNIGVPESKFLMSIEGFYHGNQKPVVTPALLRNDFLALTTVHPAFLSDDYTVTRTNALTYVITKGGKQVTAVYPDYLGLGVDYSASLATVAAARGVISAYHGLLDYVYSLISSNDDLSVSPERLAQLGIQGITTSSVFSIR